jgi:DNA-binding NtrC family response regulator
VTSKALSTHVVDGANAQLLFDAAEIQVCAGPDKGLRLELGPDSLIIGSSPDCELVLHDKTVSGRHAEIQATPRGYFIRDLGSTNGIRHGTLAIDRAPLCDGLRLSLGQSAILIRALGGQKGLSLARAGTIGPLVAQSIKMRAFVAMLEQVAGSDITVLIEGETGTGKEVAAEVLHSLSPRKSGPFVIFDCGGVSASLAPAELFGYEKGAFTGADTSRAGLLEAADGGTLFIDEIGELSLDLQPLLLRAIERKRSRRLSGDRDISHDVRIVAATNRNLAEEVRAGRFRQDLFFRLAVARLRVPPLRERTEDIPFLADRFAREAGIELSPESLAPFSSYDWPGNVRELKNSLSRMTVRSQAPRDALLDLAEARSGAFLDGEGRPLPWLEARRLANLDLERQYVQLLLLKTDGNLSQAARLAGITRQSLTTLAEKHGLRRKNDPGG